ncbi:MAG: HNH endonuclease, partial [Halobacteriota archaeon]
MASKHCYFCGIEITRANKCEAHILPNCIGGGLKSDKFICRNCDAHFGEDIDKALCEELKVITNLLNIRRDRGKPPTIT